MRDCDWCGKPFGGEPFEGMGYCTPCSEALRTCRRCGRLHTEAETYCRKCLGRPGRRVVGLFPHRVQMRFYQLQWWLVRRFPRLAAWGWVDAAMTRSGTGPPSEVTQESVSAYREELLEKNKPVQGTWRDDG